MKCSSLSASRIKTYITCPFKLYLTSHLGIDMGTNFGAEQGSLVHNILEEFGTAIKDNVDHPEIESTWIDKVLASYKGNEGIWSLSKHALERNKKCEKCCYNNDGRCFVSDLPAEEVNGCPANEFKDALNLVEMIIHDDGPTSPLSKKVVDVENKFVLRIWHEDLQEEIPVVGYIDIVTETDKNTIEIWDYKTGKWVQNYEQCKKDPQLLIYNLASKIVYPQYENVIVTIYYMRKAALSLSFGKKNEDGTVAALKYYWHTIRSDICPKRRADRSDGTVNFDFKCKNLCSPTVCAEEFKKFIEAGGYIHDNEQTPYDENKHKNKK